jgi:hypothetical protein
MCRAGNTSQAAGPPAAGDQTIFHIFHISQLKMSLPWKRLIRFRTHDGRILRGEPILQAESTIDLGLVTEADQLQARIIQGQDIYNTTGETKVTDEVVIVKQILSPLAPSDVPIIRCVGLNYAKHSMS